MSAKLALAPTPPNDDVQPLRLPRLSGRSGSTDSKRMPASKMHSAKVPSALQVGRPPILPAPKRPASSGAASGRPPSATKRPRSATKSSRPELSAAAKTADDMLAPNRSLSITSSASSPTSRRLSSSRSHSDPKLSAAKAPYQQAGVPVDVQPLQTVGSQVIKSMRLCCRSWSTTADHEVDSGEWLEFDFTQGKKDSFARSILARRQNLKDSKKPERDFFDGFEQCFIPAQGMHELQAPSEFQRLPAALQPISQETAFDVTVGKPLSALLPPVELAREEAWVTCSWVEKPYVATRSSSPCVLSVDTETSTACSEGSSSSELPEDVSDEMLMTAPEEDGDSEKELQVNVVAQTQEMSVKGMLRLFSQTNLVPNLCQVWWRVGPRSTEGFQPGEALDVSIQSLNVDNLSCSTTDAALADFDFLKPHQQKSVCWMAAREQEAELFVADWHATQNLDWQFRLESLSAPRPRCTRSSDDSCKPQEAAKVSAPSRVTLGSGPVEFQLEYRMENAYDIRGGVLADPVGSGKTATCLSHVACMHSSPAPKHGGDADWRQGYLLHLDATLVLCPDTVHHQWLAEVEKWPQLAAAIKAVSISSVSDLLTTQFKGSTKKKAKVIVAPYSLLAQQDYQQKLASPLTSTNWKHLIRGFQQKIQKQDALCGIALEGYHWRRVILDEFHELANCGQLCAVRSYKFRYARKVLGFLQSSARWGVTGTPEELLRSTGDARRAASIFQCQFNAAQSARRFCEQYYRSSRAELDVQVEERVVKVEHSGHERALYLQMARDLDCSVAEDLGPQPWDQKKLGSLRQLLQICSHFAVADSSPNEVKQATSAVDAARACHSHKKEVATRALQAVESEAGQYEAEAMGAEDQRDGSTGKGKRESSIKVATELAKRGRHAREALSKLHRASMDALRSYTFFDSVWQLVANGDSRRTCCEDESLRCAICFENFHGRETLLRCGHVFCSDCVNRALELAKHACPLCREPIDRRGIIDVQLVRQENRQLAGQEQCDASRYGSKLQAIVQALEEARAQTSDAKVIIFTQWTSLEEKIANAFSDLGISHLRLSACMDLFETRRVLERFQDPGNKDACVLFLSLDAHASGTNLTSASHVFLVHPMVAATAEQQAAYERQAIGRAARLGQKKRVTVWRFVTSGTIEDHVGRFGHPLE
eukprot:gnl/MRDRNA2_/MRDRNA2_100913_c0_seq1.p1 gnl/MRDRNA2_/MRDRNA2_100913_c0~~gnl/MRDRNA2_/MRDRNA2_100913_c0_seq1.p1  ORF type:complete len:1165 (-),score=203.16 gnl/MRDRNA2_/MRDRNA2_100913_c0_seq1:211-3705(-)